MAKLMASLADHGAALIHTASVAKTQRNHRSRRSQREGRYSKPMAGADVIDDRLPVRARRLGVAHYPVPQVRVLHVEEFIESLALALDPYPRAEGASLEQVGIKLDDDEVSPFASLRSLIDPDGKA